MRGLLDIVKEQTHDKRLSGDSFTKALGRMAQDLDYKMLINHDENQSTNKEYDQLFSKHGDEVINDYISLMEMDNKAFLENTQYIGGVKIGVLAGSLLSTLFGYFLLLITTKK